MGIRNGHRRAQNGPPTPLFLPHCSLFWPKSNFFQVLFGQNKPKNPLFFLEMTFIWVPKGSGGLKNPQLAPCPHPPQNPFCPILWAKKTPFPHIFVPNGIFFSFLKGRDAPKPQGWPSKPHPYMTPNWPILRLWAILGPKKKPNVTPPAWSYT